MSPTLGAGLRRGYAFAHRHRRYARAQREAFAAGRRPPLGTALALAAEGFLLERAGQYPGIEDPLVRADYVDDRTVLRFRMFNGKSGELLTHKDVLLRVLGSGNDVVLRHVPTHPGWATDTVTRLRARRRAFESRHVLYVPSCDPAGPRVLDHPDAATVLGTWRGLALPVNPDDTPGLDVVHIATYWGEEGPFVGHATWHRPSLESPDRSRPWPGDLLAQIHPTTGEAAGALTLEACGRTRRVALHEVPPVDPDAFARLRAAALSVARRFPNLDAVGWSFRAACAGEVELIDASNRLGVELAQLFGPLLGDPRLARAYWEAGMRRVGESGGSSEAW